MAKKNLEPYYSRVKEMYENGMLINEIAKELHLCNANIYNIISILKIPRRRRSPVIEEPVPKNLVYVKKCVKLEKVVICGKQYTDITPLFSPR